MKIKIIVAAHKPYRMPDDPIYLPLHVGRAGKESIGFLSDDTGENISDRNPNYCELTGLYWAWKNIDADAVGLVHYRRHFSSRRRRNKWESVLTASQAEKLLEQNDIILPEKRRYFIETVRSHWLHSPCAHEGDFLKFEQLMARKYEEYFPAFQTVMNRTWAHMFNMCIMKREKLNEYCEWLFGVLSALEKELDISGYSRQDARIYGFFGEFMLDIWIEKNGYPYAETKVLFMERQNWMKKGGGFLWRKITGGLPHKRMTHERASCERNYPDL